MNLEAMLEYYGATDENFTTKYFYQQQIKAEKDDKKK